MVDTAGRTPSFDAGERFVWPELRRRHVHRIDTLVLTHPDLDHIGGAASVSHRVRIGQVVVNEAFRQDDAMRTALQEIRREKTTWVSGSFSFRVGEFQVFGFAPPSTASDNDGSIVLRIGESPDCVVLTGDLGIEAEAELPVEIRARCRLLKAGHHGSKHSTGEELLNRVRPETVVFSSGARNPYGHPAREVLDRVDDVGAETLRTDRNGTIEFEWKGSALISD